MQFFLNILFVAINGVAQSPVSQADAIELACHRIERLAALRKIEKSFLAKIDYLFLVKQSGGFKVTGHQLAGAGEPTSQIDVMLDGNGKAAPFDPSHLRLASESSTAPVWPDRDAVTLLENAIHLVQDRKAELFFKPYYDGMVSARLSPVQNASGQTFARVLFATELSPALLEVVLKLDGSVDSYQLIP